MNIERIHIHYNFGDLEEIATITDKKRMESLFRNEIICAQSDFDLAEKQYFIEEIYLSANQSGSFNMFLAVCDV